jgi:hypothetical protein
LEMVLTAYTSPVFSVNVTQARASVLKAVSAAAANKCLPKIAIMACAMFDKPHTDIARAILPEKRDLFVQAVVEIVRLSHKHISGLEFVVPSSDFGSHPVLSDTLHPFFFRSLAEINGIMGTDLGAECRVYGNTGERSMDEIASVMSHNHNLFNTEMLPHLMVALKREGIEIPISSVTWSQYLGGTSTIDWAYQQVQECRDELKELYDYRVANFAWWKTVHEVLGEEVGMRRLLANAALYLAYVRFLGDNPSYITLDAEVDGIYWKMLQDILSSYTANGLAELSYIGRLPYGCQPWTY